jgi:hypothetical protein
LNGGSGEETDNMKKLDDTSLQEIEKAKNETNPEERRENCESTPQITKNQKEIEDRDDFTLSQATIPELLTFYQGKH